MMSCQSIIHMKSDGSKPANDPYRMLIFIRMAQYILYVISKPSAGMLHIIITMFGTTPSCVFLTHLYSLGIKYVWGPSYIVSYKNSQ